MTLSVCQKSLLLLNRVFRVGVDQTGQYLDTELDLRHAPLISKNQDAIRTLKQRAHHETNYKCWKEAGVRF